MKVGALLVGLCCLFSFVVCFEDHHQTVILVSFDAFRWDYLHKGFSPALEKIASDGVRVRQVKNVFPTKTFPNHYSMVSGLNPESHGIVANNMYDPALEANFTIGNKNPKWWNGAEPIWVTLRRRGLVTAAVNFPGSDVMIRGVRPNFYNDYDSKIPFRSRVDRAIGWLTGGHDRPSFIALYFEEPDETGHNFGPNSKHTMLAVKRVDDIAKYLMQRLREAKLLDSVNVLFTSDHGMMEQSEQREIYLDDLVEPSLYDLVDYSPLAAIRPQEGMLEAVYHKLLNAHPKLVVMLRKEVPERLHYRHNRRIQPILALADPGWSIYRNKADAEKNRNGSRGAHGYDNSVAAMHPYFIATGPAFRRRFAMPTMNLVDIYPLMFHLLGQEPLPCNGTMRLARRLLGNRNTSAGSGPAGLLQTGDSPSRPVDKQALRRASALVLALGGLAAVLGALLASRSV